MFHHFERLFRGDVDKAEAVATDGLRADTPPAAYRRIEKMDATRLEFFAHRARLEGVTGGLVDNHRVRGEPFGESARTENHRTHLPGGLQAGQDDVAGLPHFAAEAQATAPAAASRATAAGSMS